MNTSDIQRKNLILIDYLNTLTSAYLFKAEYSTNDNDKNVIVVQEETGEKQVFFDGSKHYNYYNFNIYGLSIEACKSMAVQLNELVGNDIYYNITNTIDGVSYTEHWQIIFQQFSNAQPVEYLDIRRIGYTMTLKCTVNLINRVENS